MIRILGALAAALALLAGTVDPAHADPVSILILSFIGIEATSFAVAATTFLLGLAASIGLGYLARALGPKPPDLPSLPGGTTGRLQTGGTIARSFIIGRGMTAGSLAYANTYAADSATTAAGGLGKSTGAEGNTPNAYLVQVIALSDIPVTGLVTGLGGILVGGVPATYNPAGTEVFEGFPVSEYAKDGKDYLWIRFYDGTQVAADPALVALFSADVDRPYDSNRIGTGVAYAIVTARYNTDLFGSFPQIKFIIDGLKLYDRRLDSSAGGSGAQRWSDRTTWEWTQNPIVIAENILRGISYAGQWLYGAQTVSAAQLPAASWMAAASECDAAIALVAGGTEPQYTANGEIGIDHQPADTLDELMKACNGKLAEIGGAYKVRAGAPGSAVFSFTDDDLLSTEEQDFDPFPSLGQTINAVTAKYVEPSEAWNPKDAPSLYDSALEAADGGRRLPVDINYPMVTSGTAAQRLMKSARDDHRAFRTHKLQGPPDCFVLEPLDVISWTSARNGYTSKLFDITAADDLPNLNMGLAVKEVDPNAYDWTPATDEQPISNGSIGPLVTPPQAIIDWDAIPYSIVADAGSRAAIQLIWDPNTDDVTGIEYEIRLTATAEVVAAGSIYDQVKRGSAIISHNIIWDTAYEARGRYIPASPRDTQWSDYIGLTTPDLRVAITSLEESLKLYIGNIENRVNEIATLAQGVANWAAEQFGKNEIDKTAMQVLSSSQTGNAVALVATLTQTVTTNQAALASYQLLVSATLDGHTTSIASNTTAIAGINGKLAASFGVTLTVDGYASGFYNYNTGVGSSAFIVHADFFQFAKPGAGGAAPTTIFTAGTVNGVSTIGINGNLFIDGTINALQIAAGAITAVKLAANSVVAGKIDVGAINAGNIIVDNILVTGHLVVGSATTSGKADFSASSASGVFVTIASVTLSTIGGIAEVSINCNFAIDNTSGGSTVTETIEMMVDGVSNKQWTISVPAGGLVDQPFTFRKQVTGLSDGSHTFLFRSAQLTWGAGQMQVFNPRR